MELIRTIILSIGWPILIIGSTYITAVIWRFYLDVGKTVFGKLVLAMVIGWFVSMYSLGITATAYMFADVRSGVLVVLPIFFVWFITMVIISWTALRWSKETVTLNAFYRGLEDLVKKRTGELEKSYKIRLENEKEIRKLREQFVFVAAHELRTPVTAMEWGLTTILEDEKVRNALPRDYQELLVNLREKNKKLLELVSDLLNVARFRNDTLTFELEDISFKEVMGEVRENIGKIPSEQGISIIWPDFEEILPPVRAHSIYLKEILMNLIVNAIRYNKHGGWIKIETEVVNKDFIIRVRDNGIGMTSKEMEHLFEEFYRVKNEETKNIEGTGLGLFITKQLLDRIGGKISVESKKGDGSTFTVLLPHA